MTRLVALSVSLLSATAAAQQAKPNVLFIAVDDLRPEFGAYGRAHVKTPNLDKLATSGMVFRRAYCQQAVCSPSRSSLLTGTRPDTTKVWDLETHFRKALPGVVTLPQFFKQNGWFTQGMGKLYHSGFDDAPSWSVPSSSPKVQLYGLPQSRAIVARRLEAAKKAGKTAKEANRLARGPAFEASPVPDETFHDGALAEMAVAALRDLKKQDRPFWLGVGFLRPHLPFVAPQKYWDLYDPKTIELASNPVRPKGAPSYAIVEGGEMRAYDGIPAGHIPDDLARKLKHGYYASISYMDAQVGRVLDELDRLGLRQNTIVVLWGDHGWKLGEHDAWCKHTNCELDTNAPLIVSAPGMKAVGKHSDALVEFVDIYPTLAELAGLAPPNHVEGVSFAPLLNAPDRPWKAAAFSQYPRGIKGKQLMGYSLRTDRWRYTRWVDRKDPSKVDAVELYDHSVDPAENTNVAADPKNAEVLKQLAEQWSRGWREAVPAK